MTSYYKIKKAKTEKSCAVDLLKWHIYHKKRFIKSIPSCKCVNPLQRSYLKWKFMKTKVYGEMLSFNGNKTLIDETISSPICERRVKYAATECAFAEDFTSSLHWRLVLCGFEAIYTSYWPLNITHYLIIYLQSRAGVKNMCVIWILQKMLSVRLVATHKLVLIINIYQSSYHINVPHGYLALFWNCDQTFHNIKL